MNRPKDSPPPRELLTTAIAVGMAAVAVIAFSALSPAACGPPPPATAPHTPPSASASASLPAPAPAPPPAPAESVAASTTPAIVDAPVAWSDPGPLGASPEGNEIPRLPRFFSALASLAAKERKDHVRILWMGDSHTQADIWTNAVRVALQQRFAVGGPGFVHVGWNTYGYRHAGVELSVDGRWAVEPKTLVSGEPVGDGVFGLGGVRLVPRGGDSRAAVRVSSDALPGRGQWDLAYRFVNERASFRVTVTGAPERVLQADTSSLGQIQHVLLESVGPGGELQVSAVSIGVQMLGVTVEALDAPGVVLDTLGLNGARVRSALTLEESTWVAEVARRRPDLAVIVYGTNESSDVKINAGLVVRRFKELLGRIRAASPESDCLIFGPIDRGGAKFEDAVEALNAAQRTAALESGCAFWNGQLAMGGKGSMSRWATANPALGAGDRVHLYTGGYQKLGEMLARDLLQGFDAGTPSQ